MQFQEEEKDTETNTLELLPGEEEEDDEEEEEENHTFQVRSYKNQTLRTLYRGEKKRKRARARENNKGN